MKNIKNYVFGILQLAIVIVVLFSTPMMATVHTFDLSLSGQNEVPPVVTPATGIVIGDYDDVANLLHLNLMFNGLIGNTTAAHIHGPAGPGINGPVSIMLVGFPAGVTSGTYEHSFVLTPDQESQLLAGLMYVNIHTVAFPGGELRSQLEKGISPGTIMPYEFTLSGLNEVPPNASPATGTFLGTYNNATNLLSFNLVFNGLIGPTTAAHIHGPAGPGINGPVSIAFVGFPAGVASGNYAHAFVLTPDQESQLLGGLLYVNIHTVAFPGGELRGQLIEGTLPNGNTGVTIPVANWALLLGALLIATYAYFMMRRRS